LKPYIGEIKVSSCPVEKNLTKQYVEVTIVLASNEKRKYKKNCSVLLIWIEFARKTIEAISETSLNMLVS